MPRKPEEPVTITFTAREWRLLAVAATRSKPASFINGVSACQELRLIADRIVTETGRD